MSTPEPASDPPSDPPSDPGRAPRYALPRWPFVPPAELHEARPRRHPVVIAGGGLAGLTLALDLALRGVPAVLLDDDDTVGVRGASSRGICYAQKSLEIFERLGIGERIRAKAVTWSVGRTFDGDEEVWAFDLQPGSASGQPPFVNLQQFYLEWFLVERLLEVGVAELRWKTAVASIEPRDDHVVVTCDTPAGRYALEAAWFVDATGANSRIRTQLGLDAHASHGTARWCITDVHVTEPLPAERWAWITAPFNEGRFALRHLMADGVWRLDYQMADDADPEAAGRPEVARERVRAQLGDGVDFELVWTGPYHYRDHLLDRFVHGRVVFVGDSAHVVSPFGARGGNNGIQDAANLGWKLALVLAGEAGPGLVESYQHERHAAAVENLAVCRRTARFLAPRSRAERRIRKAALQLARRHPFARRLVNTGRMAQANAYPRSPWAAGGATSVQDVRDGGLTLMQRLGHDSRFVALAFDVAPGVRARLAALAERRPLRVAALSAGGALAAHLGAATGEVVLVRPDAYVAARIVGGGDEPVEAAVGRALDLALERALGRALDRTALGEDDAAPQASRPAVSA